MVLAGEGGEEAAEGGDEAPDDGGQPGGLPLAHPDRQRGEEERDGDAEGAEPGWKGAKRRDVPGFTFWREWEMGKVCFSSEFFAPCLAEQ